uniref:Uncharacterized protein n=1 Tax=Arundo donax TaxID=35708 RepID=A0A0A9H6T4_ARUDO
MAESWRQRRRWSGGSRPERWPSKKRMLLWSASP